MTELQITKKYNLPRIYNRIGLCRISPDLSNVPDNIYDVEAITKRYSPESWESYSMNKWEAKEGSLEKLKEGYEEHKHNMFDKWLDYKHRGHKEFSKPYIKPSPESVEGFIQRVIDFNLSKQEQEIIYRHFYDLESGRKIAKSLNISYSTYYRRLRVILDKLKELLVQREEEVTNLMLI